MKLRLSVKKQLNVEERVKASEIIGKPWVSCEKRHQILSLTKGHKACNYILTTIPLCSKVMQCKIEHERDLIQILTTKTLKEKNS